MGFCVMGNGLGILVTGKYVPVLNTMAHGWRVSWVVLGCLAGCIALVCFLLLRNRPKGVKGEEGPITATLGRAEPLVPSAGKSIFYLCAAIYFLFGFTYVIYVTFLFGIGQIVGPLCGGFLAEYYGTFSSSFLLAAIFSGAAILLSLLLPSKKTGLFGTG